DGSAFGIYAQRYRTNERPTTTGLPDVLAIEDAPSTVLDLAPHFADPDGEPSPLSYSATVSGFPGLFASATVNGANQLVLDYAPNASGTATVTVRASDGGKYVEASFTVTVLAVNDPPTARPDAYS